MDNIKTGLGGLLAQRASGKTDGENSRTSAGEIIEGLSAAPELPFVSEPVTEDALARLRDAIANGGAGTAVAYTQLVVPGEVVLTEDEAATVYMILTSYRKTVKRAIARAVYPQNRFKIRELAMVDVILQKCEERTAVKVD